MIATRSEGVGGAVMAPGDGADHLSDWEMDGDAFRFEASDVTGTHHVAVSDVQRSLPVGAVAKALASRMSLPENVPWSLHDAGGAFLRDDEPIGEQIAPGSQVTVAPKTHLG